MDVVKKRCVCGCAKPAFALFGNPPERCKLCKSPDMVDVINRKCICGKHQPHFGWRGDKRGQWCVSCKEPGMVSLDKKYTRKRKKTSGVCNCGRLIKLRDECNKPFHQCQKCRRICHCGSHQSTFGYLGADATACKACRKPGMVDVKNRTCACGRSVQPTFGRCGDPRASCCLACRSLDMVDLKSRKCSGCGLTNVQAPRHLCADCDDTRPRRRKTRESMMVEFLKNKFPDISIAAQDRTIPDTACSKFRPDVLYLVGQHAIVVECDEDQHGHIPLQCEQRRMVSIAQDCQMPTIFIRFNPDKKGVEMKAALQELGKAIEPLFNDPPVSSLGIDVIYLFYDNQPHHIRRHLELDMAAPEG